MLEFRPLSVADKEKMEKICYESSCPGPENCFNSMFIWRHLYKPEIAYYGEQVILRFMAYKKPTYSFPMGPGNLDEALEAMKDHADSMGERFIVMGHGEEQATRLEIAMPGCFDVTWDRDYSAYIHTVDSLADYPGKSLHSKRNFCNQFEANNEWEFVPISGELIPQCMEFMDKWLLENAERLDSSVSQELTALLTAFENFEALRLEGGALYVNGEMVGFTMGEKCTDNCFICHFEKARYDVKGSYPMVCRELARMVRENHPGLKYINREEDMGIEALRRSKLSYKPEFLLHQFFARCIDESVEDSGIYRI